MKTGKKIFRPAIVGESEEYPKKIFRKRPKTFPKILKNLFKSDSQVCSHALSYLAIAWTL